MRFIEINECSLKGDEKTPISLNVDRITSFKALHGYSVEEKRDMEMADRLSAASVDMTEISYFDGQSTPHYYRTLESADSLRNRLNYGIPRPNPTFKPDTQPSLAEHLDGLVPQN